MEKILRPIKVYRLRYVFELRNGYTPSKNDLSFWSGGTIPWFRMEDIRKNGRILSDSIQHITSKAIKGGGLFSANSFILATTATIGEHALLITDSLANQRFTNLKVRKSLMDKFDIKFLFYYMYKIGEWCKNSVNTTCFSSVNIDDLKSQIIPLFTLEEQKAIASYLDNITVELDNAINQQQQMIDLLNERKQIIIQQALTKGIDDNIEIKETSIEWIGRIPAHWIIRKGKFIFNVVNNLSTTGEEELLTVSDKTGITPRSMKNVNMFMSESLIGYKKCKVGDVCSNIMWMWHGAVGVTQYDGVISPSYAVYRQQSCYYNAKYLDYLLRNPKLVQLYGVLSTGVNESRLRLYPNQFLDIPFFIPPLKEQSDIIKKIEKNITPIEEAILRHQQLINLLQERKQIIISEVVTGKIKVS